MQRSKREMWKSLVWVLGPCLSRYPFSGVFMTMSCAGITQGEQQLAQTVRRRRETELVGQPNIRAVAFSWSSTERSLVNDADVHISGVFRERPPPRARAIAKEAFWDTVRQVLFLLHHKIVQRNHCPTSSCSCQPTHALAASESVHFVNDEQRLIVWKIVVWSGAIPFKSWRGVVGKKGREVPFQKVLRADMAHVWRVLHTTHTQRKERLRHVCPS